MDYFIELLRGGLDGLPSHFPTCWSSAKSWEPKKNAGVCNISSNNGHLSRIYIRIDSSINRRGGKNANQDTRAGMR